jgi:hypothetical protein
MQMRIRHEGAHFGALDAMIYTAAARCVKVPRLAGRAAWLRRMPNWVT